jgi:hypothetical protein
MEVHVTRINALQKALVTAQRCNGNLVAELAELRAQLQAPQRPIEEQRRCVVCEMVISPLRKDARTARTGIGCKRGRSECK